MTAILRSLHGGENIVSQIILSFNIPRSTEVACRLSSMRPDLLLKMRIKHHTWCSLRPRRSRSGVQSLSGHPKARSRAGSTSQKRRTAGRHFIQRPTKSHFIWIGSEHEHILTSGKLFQGPSIPILSICSIPAERLFELQFSGQPIF